MTIFRTGKMNLDGQATLMWCGSRGSQTSSELHAMLAAAVVLLSKWQADNQPKMKPFLVTQRCTCCACCTKATASAAASTGPCVALYFAVCTGSNQGAIAWCMALPHFGSVGTQLRTQVLIVVGLKCCQLQCDSILYIQATFHSGATDDSVMCPSYQ